MSKIPPVGKPSKTHDRKPKPTWPPKKQGTSGKKEKGFLDYLNDALKGSKKKK